MPLLEVAELQKTYGDRRVVDGVNLHVDPGEIVGLLGQNGAGKTTTFRMVMGLLKPEKGRVTLEGRDITGMPMYRRARLGIGYLAQESSIFRQLSVEDNVLSILETRGLPHRDRRQRLAELLHDMGLTRIAHSAANTVSGGERRRLEIARALVGDPKVLLLDEPFSAIDPKTIEDIQKIITMLRQGGMSILLTDHNVFETFAIVDRAYIISEGRVLKHGSPSELIEDPETRRLYLGDKFADYGDAFRKLREDIDRKGRAHARDLAETRTNIKLSDLRDAMQRRDS